MVAWLRANGYPDARRYLAGDGRQPGDVDFHPLVVLEVKDVAQSRWPSWCRQAAAEAREGMVPVVVRRTRGVADPGAWECRVLWMGWRDATGTALFHALHLNRKRDQGARNQLVKVDHDPWGVTTLSEFIAALRRFDALDGAA